MAKRCRIQPQGKQEQAELVILGDLLGSTEPKALPPAKELKALPPAKETKALPPAKKQESGFEDELEDFFTRKEEEKKLDPEVLAELEGLEVLPDDEPVTKKAKRQKAPPPAKKQERKLDPELAAPKKNKAEISALRDLWNKAYKSKDKDTDPVSLALQTLFKEVMRPNRATTDPEVVDLRRLVRRALVNREQKQIGYGDKNVDPVALGFEGIAGLVDSYQKRLVKARNLGAPEKAYDPRDAMLQALLHTALFRPNTGEYLKEMINEVRSGNRKRGKG